LHSVATVLQSVAQCCTLLQHVALRLQPVVPCCTGRLLPLAAACPGTPRRPIGTAQNGQRRPAAAERQPRLFAGRTDVALGEDHLAGLIRAVDRFVRCAPGPNAAPPDARRQPALHAAGRLPRVKRQPARRAGGTAELAPTPCSSGAGPSPERARGPEPRASACPERACGRVPSAAISSAESSARHLERISMFWIAIESHAVRSASCIGPVRPPCTASPAIHSLSSGARASGSAVGAGAVVTGFRTGFEMAARQFGMSESVTRGISNARRATAASACASIACHRVGRV
jgi:hypothetical protein